MKNITLADFDVRPYFIWHRFKGWDILEVSKKLLEEDVIELRKSYSDGMSEKNLKKVAETQKLIRKHTIKYLTQLKSMTPAAQRKFALQCDTNGSFMLPPSSCQPVESPNTSFIAKGKGRSVKTDNNPSLPRYVNRAKSWYSH